jgi:serine/threonine protein kinase
LAERRSSLLTTQVALKMPLVAENDVEAVRQEAALWLRASGHPNIVPVLDAEVYNGQVVIASEFIAGGSLHEWMQAQGAPSVESEVMQQIVGFCTNSYSPLVVFLVK